MLLYLNNSKLATRKTYVNDKHQKDIVSPSRQKTFYVSLICFTIPSATLYKQVPSSGRSFNASLTAKQGNSGFYCLPLAVKAVVMIYCSCYLELSNYPIKQKSNRLLHVRDFILFLFNFEHNLLFSRSIHSCIQCTALCTSFIMVATEVFIA